MLKYNSIPRQNLYSPNQLTIQTWNDTINILSAQTNDIVTWAIQLETLLNITPYEDGVSLLESINNIKADLNDLITRISTITDNITSLISQANTNADNITSLDTRVTLNTNNITALDTQVSTNINDISSLNAQVSNIPSLTSQVNANSDNITALDTRVTLNTNITTELKTIYPVVLSGPWDPTTQTFEIRYNVPDNHIIELIGDAIVMTYGIYIVTASTTTITFRASIEVPSTSVTVYIRLRSFVYGNNS